MKSILKFSKVLFGSSILFLAISFCNIFAMPAPFKLVISKGDSGETISRYEITHSKIDFPSQNQYQQFKNDFKKLNKILNYSESCSFDFTKKSVSKNINQLMKTVLSFLRIEEEQSVLSLRFEGNSLLLSVATRKLLDEKKFLNLLILVSDPSSSNESHYAALFLAEGGWRVADSYASLTGRLLNINEPSILYDGCSLPLDQYEKLMKGKDLKIVADTDGGPFWGNLCLPATDLHNLDPLLDDFKSLAIVSPPPYTPWLAPPVMTSSTPSSLTLTKEQLERGEKLLNNLSRDKGWQAFPLTALNFK